MKNLIFLIILINFNLFSTPEFDDIDLESRPEGNWCVSLDKKSKNFMRFKHYEQIKEFMVERDLHKVFIRECGGKNIQRLTRSASECDLHKIGELDKCKQSLEEK